MRQSSAWVMSANGQMLAGSHAFQTRELVERALESAALPFKGNMPNGQLDSDEEFETNLRRELIEIALVNGVSDVETLRDVLIATRSEVLNVDPLTGHQRIRAPNQRKSAVFVCAIDCGGHVGDTLSPHVGLSTKDRSPAVTL